MTTIGKDVEFYCKSLGQVKWTFVDGDMPDNIEINDTKKFIKIRNVSMQNAGYYKCFNIDYKKSISAMGKLEILSKKL